MHINQSLLFEGPTGAAFQDYRLCVSNPHVGGAEAEGFGVGVDDEEPTPALRDRCLCAPPSREGISGQPPIHCTIQVGEIP